MSEIAIRAEKLSKQYTISIGSRRHDTLRDQIVEGLKALARRNGHPRPRRETFWALQDVSFEVKRGEVMGIIGPNGSGKSTLLKVLSRITEPTTGQAEIHGRVGSLLEVGTGFHQELTGRENIYLNGAILGMKKAEIDRKFDEILAFAGVERFIDTPVKRYSSGMYVRLAFSVAAHLEPEILLVDEVLAVGDAAFQRKCLGKLRDVTAQGRTVVFVSHNMAVVRNLCSRALLLQSGQVRAAGETEHVVQRYLEAAYDHQTTPLPLSERTDRLGSGTVRIVSFNAHSYEGELPRTGAGIELEVRYVALEKETIGKLFLAIRVKDVLGNSVFGCSTAMTNSDFFDAPPKGRISCRLDHLPLVPGRYWIDLKMLDTDNLADHITNAATFDVVDGTAGRTLNYLSPEWGGSVTVPHEWCLQSPLATDEEESGA